MYLESRVRSNTIKPASQAGSRTQAAYALPSGFLPLTDQQPISQPQPKFIFSPSSSTQHPFAEVHEKVQSTGEVHSDEPEADISTLVGDTLDLNVARALVDAREKRRAISAPSKRTDLPYQSNQVIGSTPSYLEGEQRKSIWDQQWLQDPEAKWNERLRAPSTPRVSPTSFLDGGEVGQITLDVVDSPSSFRQKMLNSTKNDEPLEVPLILSVLKTDKNGTHTRSSSRSLREFLDETRSLGAVQVRQAKSASPSQAGASTAANDPNIEKTTSASSFPIPQSTKGSENQHTSSSGSDRGETRQIFAPVPRRAYTAGGKAPEWLSLEPIKETSEHGERLWLVAAGGNSQVAAKKSPELQQGVQVEGARNSSVSSRVEQGNVASGHQKTSASAGSQPIGILSPIFRPIGRSCSPFPLFVDDSREEFFDPAEHVPDDGANAIHPSQGSASEPVPSQSQSEVKENLERSSVAVATEPVFELSATPVRSSGRTITPKPSNRSARTGQSHSADLSKSYHQLPAKQSPGRASELTSMSSMTGPHTIPPDLIMLIGRPHCPGCEANADWVVGPCEHRICIFCAKVWYDNDQETLQSAKCFVCKTVIRSIIYLPIINKARVGGQSRSHASQHKVIPNAGQPYVPPFSAMTPTALAKFMYEYGPQFKQAVQEQKARGNSVTPSPQNRGVINPFANTPLPPPSTGNSGWPNPYANPWNQALGPNFGPVFPVGNPSSSSGHGPHYYGVNNGSSRQVQQNNKTSAGTQSQPHSIVRQPYTEHVNSLAFANQLPPNHQRSDSDSTSWAFANQLPPGLLRDWDLQRNTTNFVPTGQRSYHAPSHGDFPYSFSRRGDNFSQEQGNGPTGTQQMFFSSQDARVSHGHYDQVSNNPVPKFGSSYEVARPQTGQSQVHKPVQAPPMKVQSSLNSSSSSSDYAWSDDNEFYNRPPSVGQPEVQKGPVHQGPVHQGPVPQGLNTGSSQGQVQPVVVKQLDELTQHGKPSYELAAKHMPFSEPARYSDPSRFGVVKIYNIPYMSTRNEIIAFLGRNARIINPSQGCAVHIIMERATAKTMDCYAEFLSERDALNSVKRFERNRIDGHHDRIGERHVEVELSGQDSLMKALFPRAKNVVWTNGNPNVVQSNEPYNSGFKGFITSEELVMVLRHAEAPNRSPFCQKCRQRTFESMISTLVKYPWWATDKYTLDDRDSLFRTTEQLIRALVRDLQREPILHLNEQLLHELVRTGIEVPAFSETQKYLLLAAAEFPKIRHNVCQLAPEWAFEVLSFKPDAEEKVVLYYISLLREATTSAALVPLAEMAANASSNATTPLFGNLKVPWPKHKAYLSMAQAANIEWNTVEVLLRRVLESPA
ncbi:MAG: hypothetical protein M1819_004186 [Sarea resinae]|nr:MAG: hypothetical protein M1819_004186 [Sarea resinae]